MFGGKHTHENNMNAYEIRLNLLGMAKQLIYDAHAEKCEIAREQWYFAKDLYQVNLEKGIGAKEAPTFNLPEYPSSDDIIKKAKDLYTFVKETSE